MVNLQKLLQLMEYNVIFSCVGGINVILHVEIPSSLASRS